jgi:amidase
MKSSFQPRQKHGHVNRRQAVQLGGGLVLTALAGHTTASPAVPCPLQFEEYAKYDALGLAELVQKKAVTPEELLDVAIARAEAVNPKINAIVVKLYDEARQAIACGLPDGPFSGVPFLVKDLLFQMKGVECSHSSRSLQGYKPDQDDTVVQRYRQAGLVIFGRTHSPEFGLTAITDSALYGVTSNPWNRERTAGGSSGGTAAAIAAGVVPMGSGNDGGGSIRIPASCCGLFGMKPTRARVPLGPDLFEGCEGLVVAHALTRSVRDSAALLDATAGPDRGDAYAAPPQARPYREEIRVAPGRLRVALAVKAAPDQEVGSECRKAAENAAKLCEELGHRVEDVSDRFQQHIPWIDLRDAWHTALEANVSAWILGVLKQQDRELREDDVEPVTREIIDRGQRHAVFDLIGARMTFHRASRLMAEFQEEYDVILTPTLGQLPVPHGQISLSGSYEDYVSGLAAFQPFTPLANATGQPAMSVPLHWADGLPVGVHFCGRFGDEATLFRLAAQLEIAKPWNNKRPAI